jgi:predicted ArsR family transcriptional regulator
MRNLTHVLSSSQTELLDVMKREGEITVEEASSQLELAPTTIRQHISRLEELGLVERRKEIEGRGRPTLHFSHADLARQLYPSMDDNVLGDLLDFLGREGYHGAIDDFFRKFWEVRRKDFEERLDEADATSLEERLEVLESFLDEQGFMPEIEIRDNGDVQIRECNCPLKGAVEQTRLPCRLEAQFLQEVVGKVLNRVEYIPNGHTACSYEFSTDKDDEIDP